MTCQIIVIYILFPAIYFCYIHNPLLHYIIITVIIDEDLSGFIYFLTIEKHLFALFLYAISFFFDAVIRIYFRTAMCVSPSLRSSYSQMFFIISVLKNFAVFTGKHLYYYLFIFSYCNMCISSLGKLPFADGLRNRCSWYSLNNFLEHLWWLLLFLEDFFSVSPSFYKNIFVSMYLRDKNKNKFISILCKDKFYLVSSFYV